MTNKEVIDTLILTNELKGADKLICENSGLLRDLSLERQNVLSKYYSEYKKLGCDCYHILYLIHNMSIRNFKSSTYELIFNYIKGKMLRNKKANFSSIAVRVVYTFIETDEEDIELALIYE